MAASSLPTQSIANTPRSDESEADLTARVLEVANPQVARAALDTAKFARTEEQSRFARLDTKATSLLASAGISVALIGGLALKAETGGAKLLLALAGLIGLVASAMALRALQTQPVDTGFTAERIFHQDLLAYEPSDAESRYLGYQAVDHWFAAKALTATAETKARHLSHATRCFLGAIVTTFAGTIALVIGL